MEVFVVLPCRMDISVSRIGPTSRILVDPLQPVLSTMSGHQILQVVRNWNVLRFRRPQEVLHDGIGVVAEADFDGSLETVNVTVLGCPLIRLVLLHQRDQGLRVPPLHLEVVII